MEFTTADLKTLFGTISARMATERDRLCALDGVIGDADHGIAMEQGMKAAADAAQAAEGTLQEVFNAAAKGFLNAVGATFDVPDGMAVPAKSWQPSIRRNGRPGIPENLFEKIRFKNRELAMP